MMGRGIKLTFCLLAAVCSITNSQQFPEDFKFGAASAAYQVEGHNTVGGRGPSIWDDFVKIPGKIADGSSGDDGPDSYLHYKDDVKLLKDMGMQYYRFSISWSRVMSDGTLPSLNEEGLKYYDDLINELIDNDIEPMVTMYHWDLPSHIHDLGGLVSPLFPDYFEQYAKVLFERYGDRVKNWITFNEPKIYCVYGYARGTFPPAHQVPGGEYYCLYYTQLAHARVYHMYKETFFERQQGRIGLTFYSNSMLPKDPNNPDDVAGAELAQLFELGTYAHPIFSKEGGFPEAVKNAVDRNSEEEGRTWSRLPKYDQATLEYVRGTADFFGLNYYTSQLVEGAPATSPEKKPFIEYDARVAFSNDPNWVQADSDWLFSVPEGLKQLLLWITKTYDTPEIMIFENGWSDHEDVGLEDLDRIEYLRLHMNAVLEAINEGAKVTAHTTWCLVDNFEWLMGYTEKFGLHTFDPVTKARTAKKSAAFLKEVTEKRVLPEKGPTVKFP